MPAKKAAVNEQPGMGELLGMDPTGRDDRIDALEDLLAWVGRAIVTRNANGRKSDKFCRLCAASRLLKEPCRHTQVWAVANK